MSARSSAGGRSASPGRCHAESIPGGRDNRPTPFRRVAQRFRLCLPCRQLGRRGRHVILQRADDHAGCLGARLGAGLPVIVDALVQAQAIVSGRVRQLQIACRQIRALDRWQPPAQAGEIGVVVQPSRNGLPRRGPRRPALARPRTRADPGRRRPVAQSRDPPRSPRPTPDLDAARAPAGFRWWGPTARSERRPGPAQTGRWRRRRAAADARWSRPA